MKDQTQLNKINPILLTLCLLSVLSSVSGRADIIRPYAVTASGQYNTTDSAAARLIDPAAYMPQTSPYLRLD